MAAIWFRLIRFGTVFKQISSFGKRTLVSEIKGAKDGPETESAERPTKPVNPYFIFLSEKRQKITESNPGLKYKDVLRLIGDLWNNLPNAEKQKYNDEYQKERDEFKKLYEIWWNRLSLKEKNDFLQSKSDENKKKLKRTHFRKLLDLGRPRRPLSAINYFVVDQYKNDNDNNKDFASIAEVWKRMNEEERKPYDELARKDFERFTKEKLVWELKMMREGKGNLIETKERKTKAVRKKRANEREKNTLK